MRRNKDIPDKDVDRPNRLNGDPVVLVPLSMVKEPRRSEEEDRLLTKQLKQREHAALVQPKKGGRTDAYAIPGDASGYVRRDVIEVDESIVRGKPVKPVTF